PLQGKCESLSFERSDRNRGRTSDMGRFARGFGRMGGVHAMLRGCRASVVPTGLAALLAAGVALTVDHPSLAFALHLPLFWLIGWSAAQLLPRRWATVLGASGLSVAVALLVARWVA